MGQCIKTGSSGEKFNPRFWVNCDVGTVVTVYDKHGYNSVRVFLPFSGYLDLGTFGRSFVFYGVKDNIFTQLGTFAQNSANNTYDLTNYDGFAIRVDAASPINIELS